MHNERDEQVIFIKDLLFAALYRWRRILIAAIAAAVLLSGLVVLAGLSKQSNTDIVPESPVETVALRKSITQQTAYLKNSALMHIDPYHAAKATANISIFTDNIPAEENAQPVSYIGTLLNSYSSAIMDRMGEEAATDALEMTSADLLELIAVTTAIHGTADGTVTITVLHSEQEKAEQILSFALEILPSTTETLQSIVAPHGTNTITTSAIQKDAALLDRQAKELKYLDDLKVSLNKAIASNVTESPSDYSLKALLKQGILFGIIGAILGAGVAACVIWIAHFSSTKVYSARTLSAWTGVKILGCAEGSRPKCAIDRWLRKLEGRADAAALPVTAAIAANYATESAVFLICTDEACPQAVQKALCEKIPTARLCGSLTKDISAVEALPGCGAVLLVAVCGKTRYSDVARQLQLIHDQRKSLAGCLVIDG